VIDNQSAAAHKVGLRLQLDTLIGGNDGVPFTVPGQPGLIDTSADFQGFMEGGCESGERAAREILGDLGITPPAA
jgi:hypothetical protein